jgi:N-6 DNA methylase
LKEYFSLPESKAVWNHLETASMRSHHNPRQAFEDFLTMTVCSLSGGQMEDEYMALVPRYSEGVKGKRAIDSFPEAFGALIEGMEKTRQDILGDVFQGGVTFGENGQFFTPDHLCRVMAQMNMSAEDTGKRILDPACGSGRTLLACADINPNNEFYGQDVDLRCVQMTAINLALRNLYGWVIWGNSLAMEERMIYRTGFNGKGVIQKIEPEECPEPVRAIIEEPETVIPAGPAKQLSLF